MSPAEDSALHLEVSSVASLPGEYPEPSNSSGSGATAANISVAQSVYARRAEYTHPASIKIKVGTWNVASFKDTDKDLGNWFVDSNGVSGHLAQLQGNPKEEKPTETQDSSLDPTITYEDSSTDKNDRPVNKPSDGLSNHPPNNSSANNIGIYALGLQEVVDINSAVEAFRPYSDLSTSSKFKTAMEKAIPSGYQLVAEQQLIGLLLLIYVAPDVVPHIHNVSTTSAGTGLMGYMGNKGAVAARLVLGETTRLLFVNCHLSSGAGKAELERRNWDATTILNRIRFQPITGTFDATPSKGEKIGTEDFAFWFGDLNYRLEGIPGDDVRRILTRHTHTQDTVSGLAKSNTEKISKAFSKSFSLEESSSNQNDDDSDDAAQELDPTSLQATINSLLPHDELHQQQLANKAFHQGWREGPIDFLPTYKYDVGSLAVFDSGEKKRAPSWCDRILYRTKKDLLHYEERARLEQQAKDRDIQITSLGLANAAEDENTMFEYDPETDGDDDDDDRSNNSDGPDTNGLENSADSSLKLEYYVPYHKIKSSDHKPLEAVFNLTYDAVDTDLKSKIQAEVARDFDRAENEGRPIVTVVVEGGSQADDPSFDGINFGNIRYDEPKTCFITLANTGRVTTCFGFIDRPQQANGDTPLPAWLSINIQLPLDHTEPQSPEQNTKTKSAKDSWSVGISKVFRLEPGESATVDLMCHVKDRKLLKNLNDGNQLENVLILRVKEGRDHFLPIKGSWRSSIQGRTIDRLIRIPEGGVRALQDDVSSISSEQHQPTNQTVMWSAPREIFRLTECIESLTERITAEWSMLGKSTEEDARPPMLAYAGWPFVEESWTLDKETRQKLRVDINEALDTDRSFDSTVSSKLPPLHRLEVFADTLLDFLENLEDGVIPASLWEKLDSEFFAKEKLKNKLTIDEKKASILEILSSSQGHNISFVLLTSMLARISQDIISSMEGFDSDSRTSLEIPESPKVKIKRKSLSQNPREATKLLIQKNFSAVFADVLIRTSEDSGKGKGRNTSQAHRIELVEIFLEGDR